MTLTRVTGSGYKIDYPNEIRGHIEADVVEMGYGVVIEEGVEIRAKHVVIGDFVYIGRNCRVFTPEFRIGDYSRLNESSFAGGTKPLSIGRNCYFGREVQLDSRGGLEIHDNVGVGSLSQIWTHVRHGDPAFGCRYNHEWNLVIEKDVWLVARVTVGGARVIGERAMVLNESNVTKDIPSDTTWAGNPAKDTTEKHGKQFRDTTADERKRLLDIEVKSYELMHPEYRGVLNVCAGADEYREGRVNLDVMGRTYNKTYHPAEVGFLKSTLAKFTPRGG